MKIDTKYKQLKIKELADLTVGGTWGPEATDGNGILVLRSTNFTKDQKITFKNIAYRQISNSKLRNRILKDGDILIEVSGGGPSQPVGRALGFYNPDGNDYTYGNFVRRLKLNNNSIDNEYFLLALQALYSFGETEPIQTNTTNLRNLNFNDYLDLEIPIPELAEQKQIVSKIKECFNYLDKAEDRLIINEKKAQKLLDSVLKKALMAKRLESYELKDIAELINGDRGKNYPNKSALVKEGIPFITAGHIQDHKVDFSQMNYITEERYNILNNGKIKKDDIIFCLRGSLGKIALIDFSQNAAIASSLVIIRPSSRITSKYLYYYLLSQYGQSQIRLFDNGTAQPNLSAANLNKFIIKLPDNETQKRIVAQIEESAIKISIINKVISKQKINLEKMRQSILKKAFEGKLI